MDQGKGPAVQSPMGRRALSLEALSKQMRTLGYAGRHSVHGWRASFSTLAKDSELFDKEVVDLALDHIHDSDTARAYDRGEPVQSASPARVLVG